MLFCTTMTYNYVWVMGIDINLVTKTSIWTTNSFLQLKHFFLPLSSSIILFIFSCWFFKVLSSKLSDLSKDLSLSKPGARVLGLGTHQVWPVMSTRQVFGVEVGDGELGRKYPRVTTSKIDLRRGRRTGGGFGWCFKRGFSAIVFMWVCLEKKLDLD